jgi:hypothetical protein
MHRKSSTIQQNHHNTILFHEANPLNKNKRKVHAFKFRSINFRYSSVGPKIGPEFGSVPVLGFVWEPESHKNTFSLYIQYIQICIRESRKLICKFNILCVGVPRK